MRSGGSPAMLAHSPAASSSECSTVTQMRFGSKPRKPSSWLPVTSSQAKRIASALK